MPAQSCVHQSQKSTFWLGRRPVPPGVVQAWDRGGLGTFASAWIRRSMPHSRLGPSRPIADRPQRRGQPSLVGAQADQAKGPTKRCHRIRRGEIQMYIGVGTLVVILVIVAIIYLVRRA